MGYSFLYSIGFVYFFQVYWGGSQSLDWDLVSPLLLCPFTGCLGASLTIVVMQSD